MRKEIGKILREKFKYEMENKYPKFKKFKSGLSFGDHGYSFRYSDKVTLFVLISSPKGDVFYFDLGWACDHKFRYGCHCPLPNEDYSLFSLGEVCPEHIRPRTEFKLDHSDPLKDKSMWEFLGFSIDEFKSKMRDNLIPEEDLLRALDQRDPVEICISRIDGYLQQGMEWLDQYGMPYLLEVAKNKTLS